MRSTAYRPEYTPDIKEWKPGIARMTNYLDINEPCYWLLQVNITPYNASRAGLKYDPKTWSGRPLIRVVWVNRDGHLAEYQEWLESGSEVQVPSYWALSVDEAVFEADQFSALGSSQTQEWLKEAQESSTLIEDAVEYEFQKTEMALNRSQFGPAGKTQRNGFSQELRRKKFYESSMRWK